MANQILIKRSSVAAKVPLTTDLQLGELAINTNDGKLFLKKNNGADAIVEVGAVYTVAGRTGNVVLSTSDVSEGSNLYYTNARAQAAIGVSGTGLSYTGGVITSNATPNNTSNTIMSRDASGSFNAGTANLAGNLYTGGAVALNGATGAYSGYSSGITLNFTGNGTQHGMSFKPSSSTIDTNAINFLNSNSTYASATTVATIVHQANNAGMNLAGGWSINGVPIAGTSSNITGTAANVSGIVAVANGGTGSSSAAGALSNLGAQKNTLYAVSHNGSTGTWLKLGTLAIGQNGQHAAFRFAAGSGYNANNGQDIELYIHFKTSNGTSLDASGIAANATFYKIGQNAGAITGVKFVGNAAGGSATAYDVYVGVGSFVGTAALEVETNGTFTFSGASSVDPGASSTTVLIATESLTFPNVTSATFGSSATLLDSGTQNTVQLKGVGSNASGFIKFGNAPYAFGYDTANLVYGSRIVAFTDGSISGTAANVTGTVAIANGGTSATTAAQARANLGVVNLSGQDGYSTQVGGDLNTLINTGFYRGTGFTNAPGGNTGWFYVMVEGHDTSWTKQTATTYGSGNTANISYTRTRVGGTWSAWSQVFNDIATVPVANGGTGSTTASGALANLGAPAINPSSPKDGDVQVAAGPIISIYATGAWRQIFPAVYS